MEALTKETTKEFDKQEKELYEALDKGIDDMEKGQVIPHEDAMKIIKERLINYGL